MKAVLQRVSEARVVVDGATVGEIAQGLLVLLCAERGDTEAVGQKMLDKILKLRVFYDDAGKMNHSVQDVAGGLLVVSHSHWPPTPAVAPVPASPARHPPMQAVACTSTLWGKHASAMHWCKRVCLVRT